MANTFNIFGAVNSGTVIPNLDAKYGPYESVEAAFEYLGPDEEDIACIGLTVGIQPDPDGPITEYWFKDACESAEDLVIKKPDLTDYVEDPNYVHTDNNYTNEEKGKLTNLENYDDTEIRASLDDKVDKVSGKGLSANDYTNADKAIVDGVTDALADKVDKVGGKGLSTNDYTTNEKNKLAQLENYDDTEIRTSLSNKVDKISGKGLSTEDYTTAEKTKLSGLENYNDTEVRGLIADKVDKVSGKGLSTEDYTTAEKTKLSGIEDSADVNIIETIKVNGTALTPDANKAVDITIGAAAEYTIAEVTTTAGYAKSYQLKKDNVAVGATIDIPKDLVVSAGEVKTVTTPDVPYEGAEIGDKYIDLTLNDPNANHIYIPVDSLVSAYTAGNGIDISNANVISTKIDSTNANGLSVGANGLALAAATTTDAGAMSASDKTKLEGIAANADANVIEKIKVNSVEQTVTNKTVDIAVPTATSDLTNDSNFVVDANYVHTDNNYSTAEKTKLTNVESGAQENVIESITVNGVAATISNKNASVTISTGGGLIDSISVNGVTQTIDAQKNVDITVPTETSDLTNDSGFITKEVGNLTNYTKTSDLAAVATTGSYNDLNNKPTLFSGSYNDLTDKPELFSGDYNDLTNKPTLFSGNYNDLTNKPTIPSALADLSDDVTHRVVTDTEKATWNSKIDEPALEGTAGQVLTTDGNGGRTWTTIQGGGSGGSGSGDNSIWTDAVSCAVGATSCTITNPAITTTCTIAEYCQNASETQIGIKTRTITNGSMVLTFDALEEATEFKLHIWPTTISYTVTFDTHGGSNVDSQRVYSGDLAIRPADPSKANYVFAGWYTSDQYTTPFNFNTPISANTTIHAKWEAPSVTYTVEFNSHGGSSVSTQTINAGSVAIEPADPTKSGYTFEGWYTSDTYTTEYDFSTPVNSNLVLHAKWEEEASSHTVSFDTDGGSSISPQTVNDGGKATRPSLDPTKSGYTFDDWYTDTTYATTFDFTNTVITTDTTIYAKWEYIPQTFAVIGDGTYEYGHDFNKKIRAWIDPQYYLHDGDDTITEINFIKTDSMPASGTDFSKDQDGSIIGTLVDGTKANIYYTADALKINRGSYMFHVFRKLQTVNGFENVYWDGVTTTDHMFGNCQVLENINFKRVDMSNVNSMDGMFYGCRALPSIPTQNWDVSNVTNMKETFKACNSITELDVSTWNTSNVTDMNQTFQGLYSLSELDLSNLDFSNVTVFNYAFTGTMINIKIPKKTGSLNNTTSVLYGKDSTVSTVPSQGYSFILAD